MRTPPPENEPRPDELLVCGWDEVFCLRTAALPDVERTWSWHAADAPGLPEPMRGSFGTTDECKPVDGGRRVLVTSSGGGAALIERSDGRVLFCAPVTNAHSIEALPGGLAAVAASTGPGGNRLILYRLSNGAELADDPLPSAHGAVWDDERGVLWALGHDELRAYRVTDDRSLRLEVAFGLPDPNGHDLNAVPGSALLSVTTQSACWHFDRDRREFRPHPELADRARVKSIDVHPATGRLVWVQAEGDHWWSHHLRFLRPQAAISMPSENLYKARWCPAPQCAR